MSKKRSKKTTFSRAWLNELERRDKLANKPKIEAAKKARKIADNKSKFVKNVATKLRKKPPKSELWFLKFLEAADLSKHFQSNVQLNNYIPDFIDVNNRIIIEVDGSIHWNNEKQIAKDLKKDEYYISLGYEVYRINHKDKDSANQLISLLNQIINKLP